MSFEFGTGRGRVVTISGHNEEQSCPAIIVIIDQSQNLHVSCDTLTTVGQCRLPLIVQSTYVLSTRRDPCLFLALGGPACMLNAMHGHVTLPAANHLYPT